MYGIEEDNLENCPMCGEHMRAGQELCDRCQFQADIDEMTDEDWNEYGRSSSTPGHSRY